MGIVPPLPVRARIATTEAHGTLTAGMGAVGRNAK